MSELDEVLNKIALDNPLVCHCGGLVSDHGGIGEHSPVPRLDDVQRLLAVIAKLREQKRSVYRLNEYDEPGADYAEAQDNAELLKILKGEQ